MSANHQLGKWLEVMACLLPGNADKTKPTINEVAASPVGSTIGAIVMSNLLSVKEKLAQLMRSDIEGVLSVVDAHAKHYHDGHFSIMSFTTGVKAMFGTPDVDTGEGRAFINRLLPYRNVHEALANLLANDAEYVVSASWEN